MSTVSTVYQSGSPDRISLEEFRACLQPGDTLLVLKFRRPGIVKRIDHKRRTATVAQGSKQRELRLEELEPPSAATLAT